jgi:hypothetical protein
VKWHLGLKTSWLLIPKPKMARKACLLSWRKERPSGRLEAMYNAFKKGIEY